MSGSMKIAKEIASKVTNQMLAAGRVAGKVNNPKRCVPPQRNVDPVCCLTEGPTFPKAIWVTAMIDVDVTNQKRAAKTTLGDFKSFNDKIWRGLTITGNQIRTFRYVTMRTVMSLVFLVTHTNGQFKLLCAPAALTRQMVSPHGRSILPMSRLAPGD